MPTTAVKKQCDESNMHTMTYVYSETPHYVGITENVLQVKSICR